MLSKLFVSHSTGIILSPVYKHYHSIFLLITLIVYNFVKNMFTNMNTRLKQFLSAENISQAQFADTIKVVRASVSHVLAGRNNPSYDFMRAIMDNYPNLNIEWLMLGKGKMYKESPGSRQETLEILPSTSPEPADSGLLFGDFIDEDTAIAENLKSSSDIKTIDNIVQTSVKQRNISKIIILFDDGSFQEI